MNLLLNHRCKASSKAPDRENAKRKKFSTIDAEQKLAIKLEMMGFMAIFYRLSVKDGIVAPTIDSVNKKSRKICRQRFQK